MLNFRVAFEPFRKFCNAFVQIDSGLITDIFFQSFRIGPSDFDIARLHRQHNFFGDFSKIFFESRDEIHQFNRLTASDIYADLGTNSRLDAVQAAVLNVKRKHFAEELARRRENAAAYDAFFRGRSGFQIPEIACGNTSIYAQYALRIQDRDEFVRKMNLCEIPTRIYYERNLSLEPCFARFPSAAKDFCGNKNAYQLTQSVCCLPICAFTDVEEILQRIKTVL